MKLSHMIYGGLVMAAAALGWFGMKAKAAESPAETLRLLRAGGFTIHFRHAPTDFSQSEVPGSADTDCAGQRNLSPAGRDLARAIGSAIAASKIPVGEVRAGPLCRTMETARLIFGRAISDPDVRGGGLGKSDYPGLRRLLSKPVSPGTNNVLVGHGAQFQTVSGTGELAQGDAAVVQSLGDGKFTIVAIVRPADWTAMGALNR